MAEGRTDWGKVEGEWFVEPRQATAFLLDRERFGPLIWDPCCGQGNILLTCAERHYQGLGSDIVDRRAPGVDFSWQPLDFLGPSIVTPGDADVIMNPPYGGSKLAVAFIERAWSLPGVGKMAAFVNGKFLFSDRRATGLFAEMPPARVYPVRPRPSCPPGALLRSGEVEAKGGVENFVWLVWSRDHTGPTEFIWK